MAAPRRSPNFVEAATPKELRSLMLKKAIEKGELINWQITTMDDKFIAWYYESMDSLIFEAEREVSE